MITRAIYWICRAVCLAAIGAALAPSAVLAAFTAPLTISPPGGIASGPQVDADADGDFLVVWDFGFQIQARARSNTGVLGPVQNLSAPGERAGRAQVALDFDGDALVVWERRFAFPGAITARARSKAGVLGPVQTIAPGEVSNPQVGIDGDGDAVVVWQREVQSGDIRIQARARSKTGELGPIQYLSAPGDPQARNAKVALDADGDALIVWQATEGPVTRIKARARSKTGVLGPIQTLSPPEGSVPEVAVDADGDAMVVWSQSDVSIVQGRARSKTGVLGPLQNLSARGQESAGHQLAVDADGDALIVWESGDGSEFRIRGRARSRTGVLAPIQTLSPAGDTDLDFVGSPQVAADADGDAVVVWGRFDASDSRIRVEARTCSAAGVFGPVRTLAPASAGDAQVAIDADGDALAVWPRSFGNNIRIQASAGP